LIWSAFTAGALAAGGDLDESLSTGKLPSKIGPVDGLSDVGVALDGAMLMVVASWEVMVFELRRLSCGKKTITPESEVDGGRDSRYI
jgi:hypothetical protein